MALGLRNIAPIILGMGVVQLGTGLLTTLTGLRMVSEGFSTEVAGVVMSCYFAGQFLGARFGPRTIERVGHIRVFAAGASVLAATALGQVLLVLAPVWAILRGLTGAPMAGLIMVSESWLNDKADRASRGRLLAIYMISIYFSLSLAQFLLNLGDPAGFELFALAALLICLGVLPVTLTSAAAPPVDEPSRFGFRQIWNVSPLGVMGVLCTGLVNSSFYGMGPIFAHQIGLDTAGVSLFMGIPILAGLLMQWPMGWLSDRFDRRTVLTGVVFTVALVSAAVVPLVGVSFPAVLALATVYGGFSLTVYSLAIGHANDFISPKDLVRASSAFVMIYGIGASFGPFVASTLMSAIGPSGLFVYSAGINLGIGLFALYRMRMRKARPKDEQAPYVAVPSTTQAVKSLHPHAEWDEEAAPAAPPAAEKPADGPA